MRAWMDASEEEIRLSTAIGYLFGFDSDLTTLFFDPQTPALRKRASVIKEEAWYLDESGQGKLKAALDVWSGSGHIYLFEMLETWEKSDWIDFIKSICVLKGINPYTIEDADLVVTNKFLEDCKC